MTWRSALLGRFAPRTHPSVRFTPDREVWHLTLDQIESHTGRVLKKTIAPARHAGNSTFVFEPGTVLYSKLRPYLNKAVVADDFGIATTELVALRPDPQELDPKFLGYFLRSPGFLSFASSSVAGAKMPRLIMSKFWEYQVPLPPLPEQRRIVEILDEADRLRQLRAEADAKADRILPALFSKMFGDPGLNPRNWPEVQIQTLLQRIDAGWSTSGENRERCPSEYGVLKVSAVTSGVFRPSEHKAVRAISSSTGLVTPSRGDLLMSRANTRELVAATCLVESDEPNLFLSDKLWKLVPEPSLVTAEFLKQLFSHEVIRERFRSRSSGTSGSMLNLSQQAFLATRVPLPPLSLQERFSRHASRMMATLARQQDSARRFNDVWMSLVDRLFAGERLAADLQVRKLAGSVG